MKSFCQIYLVRHAESEGNAAGVLQGHADFPLSKLGYKQARSRAEHFRSCSFSECFASDLLRTRQTAAILSQPHALSVQTTPLLREQNFGKFNGASVMVFETELDEVLARHRQLPFERRFQHRAHPEIESDAEMMSRLLLFLRSVATENLGKTILTVSHGGIMRSLLAFLNYASFNQMKPGAIGNCGYIQLITDGNTFSILSVEDVAIEPARQH